MLCHLCISDNLANSTFTHTQDFSSWLYRHEPHTLEWESHRRVCSHSTVTKNTKRFCRERVEIGFFSILLHSYSVFTELERKTLSLFTLQMMRAHRPSYCPKMFWASIFSLLAHNMAVCTGVVSVVDNGGFWLTQPVLS